MHRNHLAATGTMFVLWLALLVGLSAVPDTEGDGAAEMVYLPGQVPHQDVSGRYIVRLRAKRGLATEALDEPEF